MCIYKYIAILTLLFSSCGHDNGTPVNGQPANDSNANACPKIEGLDLTQTVLSKNGQWRLKVKWIDGPQFSLEQPIENKLQIFFVAPDGAAVSMVKDVTLVPFMPQHGHGIGNRKPVIKTCDLGVADVSGLWFMMEGDWQFTVQATVNGVTDSAEFHATVTLK